MPFSTDSQSLSTVGPRPYVKRRAQSSSASSAYHSSCVRKATDMRLVIDYKKCLKSGQCSYLHSELITAGADGTPRVIIEQIEEHLRDAPPHP